jgi:flagellar biosynthesis chaperone FliJ
VKRFHWPLQRLLDVTHQREQSQRAELLTISRQIAHFRQQALMRRAKVQALLAEMASVELSERLRRHRDFILCSESHERQIRQLEEQISRLTVQRSDKTRQLLKTRKSRQTLERLCEQARQEHVREQLKIEQKQFDETAHVAKTRAMIEARMGHAD